MSSSTSLNVRILDGFDNPRLDAGMWSKLLARGDTHQPFLTWTWQRAWWDAFGRGELHLILAESDGPVAVAPFFADSGMVFFVGSGGSDYLDFVGDIGDPEVLSALLDAARERVPAFLGFRFYHVPDRSRTGARLREIAPALGLVCYDEGSLPAPALALTGRREAALAAARKTSLRRHERFFLDPGPLDVQHLRGGASILPHLPEFFDQHIARWGDTPYPSLFLDPAQRRFYEVLCERAEADGADWLRFTRLDWQGSPIAFHFGACYARSYLWYKPSFSIALARRSPGEVLLRRLLLAAIEEGAGTFDFGLGDESFKARFATHVETVRTWGLYPASGGGARESGGGTPA